MSPLLCIVVERVSNNNTSHILCGRVCWNRSLRQEYQQLRDSKDHLVQSEVKASTRRLNESLRTCRMELETERASVQALHKERAGLRLALKDAELSRDAATRLADEAHAQTAVATAQAQEATGKLDAAVSQAKEEAEAQWTAARQELLDSHSQTVASLTSQVQEAQLEAATERDKAARLTAQVAEATAEAGQERARADAAEGALSRAVSQVDTARAELKEAAAKHRASLLDVQEQASLELEAAVAPLHRVKADRDAAVASVRSMREDLRLLRTEKRELVLQTRELKSQLER